MLLIFLRLLSFSIFNVFFNATFLPTPADIGQGIHSKWENISHHEKSQAIIDAEKEVWKQAEHVKKIALEKCEADCLAVKEHAIKELKISHERMLKVCTLFSKLLYMYHYQQ